MYKLMLRSAFLVASVLLGAANAMAEPETYPGIMCQGLSGGTLAIDGNGHVQNQSTTSDATLICPVVTPALNVSTAPNVFVTDFTLAENICCNAALKNTGSSVIFGSQACSSGASSGAQGLAPPAPSTPFTFTHRFYQCNLPNQEGSLPNEIRTYRY